MHMHTSWYSIYACGSLRYFCTNDSKVQKHEVVPYLLQLRQNFSIQLNPQGASKKKAINRKDKENCLHIIDSPPFSPFLTFLSLLLNKSLLSLFRLHSRCTLFFSEAVTSKAT